MEPANIMANIQANCCGLYYLSDPMAWSYIGIECRVSASVPKLLHRTVPLNFPVYIYRTNMESEQVFYYVNNL